MQCLRPANSCRQCGSTNYRRLFARNASGALSHNGKYQCSGCQMNFTRTSEWRGGGEEGGLASVPDLHRAAMHTHLGLAPV